MKRLFVIGFLIVSICSIAYSQKLTTKVITCSVIPEINGAYNSADASNGDIRCMQGYFVDGSGFTWTIRFVDLDGGYYGQQHYSKRDSNRSIQKYTADNGDVYFYNFENNRCLWVIGKWKDSEGDLYYAMISNSRNEKYLFIFDKIGYQTLERQIDEANNCNVISLTSRTGSSEAIGILLQMKGLWINTINLK